MRAARRIGEADVVAYHCAGHGGSIARAAAAPYLRDGQVEEVLRYPVTTGATDHPGGYAGALADFYDEATRRLAAHLEAGRQVVVLCEGDPALYGSYQHLHARLARRFPSEIVPGVSSVAAAAAAVGRPLVQHDESLTILVGTLPPEELRARLAGADAAAILKLGRSFPEVRAALADTGLLERARYVERAGSDAQRVAPLAEVDPAGVPYMSLALVPGRGERRPGRAGRDRGRPRPRRPGMADPRGAPRRSPRPTDLVGYRPYLARVPQRPGQRRHGSGNTVEARAGGAGPGPGRRRRRGWWWCRRGTRACSPWPRRCSRWPPAAGSAGARSTSRCCRGSPPPRRWPAGPGRRSATTTACSACRTASSRGRSSPTGSTAAAAADLVLALYNPASRTRTWQVEAVRDLVLRHRDPATPVVVGRHVGRPGERVTVTTLEALDPAEVDMGTLADRRLQRHPGHRPPRPPGRLHAPAPPGRCPAVRHGSCPRVHPDPPMPGPPVGERSRSRREERAGFHSLGVWRRGVSTAAGGGQLDAPAARPSRRPPPRWRPTALAAVAAGGPSTTGRRRSRAASSLPAVSGAAAVLGDQHLDREPLHQGALLLPPVGAARQQHLARGRASAPRAGRRSGSGTTAGPGRRTPPAPGGRW